ncbi:MAG TPA: hypothetical protein PLB18_05535 [Acidobacteriota bacterium]|nr:hypothetical protein [Acidobacteriota bacterium]
MKHLAPDERLKGLPSEERFKGLTAAEIQAYLEKLLQQSESGSSEKP